MQQLCLEFERAPIPGFNGYTIDPHGNVYGKTAKPLATFLAGGYRKIMLNKRPCYIHHLVLKTFVSERPPGHEARHKNGDRLDNRVSNLCWGTKKQNARDRKRERDCYNPKIPPERKQQAQVLYEQGIGREAIALQVGCDVRTIRRYIQKYKWERRNNQDAAQNPS